MKTQFDVQTKINVAVAVLSNEKSKAEISREFGVSPRSVGRWVEQYKEEAKKIILKESEDKNALENTIKESDRKIIESYFKNKDKDLKVEDRRFKRGAPKKGVKTIRQTVLEILFARKEKGELTKANRKEIVNEISKAIGHEYSRCVWYFSKYKKLVGDYQDKD